MSDQNKTYVILPVYNEGESIYNLLKKFGAFFSKDDINHEIIIVNDCSSDNTEDFIFKAQKEIETLNICYVKHESNKGLGGALLSGVNHLEAINDDDVVLTMDSDDTHNPFLIREMFNKINEGADIVISSRYCEQSRITGVSTMRVILSIVANFLYSIIWRLKGVKDYTCDYRMYSGAAMNAAKNKYKDELIKESGFTSATELLKKVYLSIPSAIVVEVPMILKYGNKMGKSNLNVLNSIFKTICILFRI